MHVQYEERIDWVDLSPYGLPWSDDGLRQARELVQDRQRELVRQGWLSSFSDSDFGLLRLRGRARRAERVEAGQPAMIIGLRLRSRRGVAAPDGMEAGAVAASAG